MGQHQTAVLGTRVIMGVDIIFKLLRIGVCIDFLYTIEVGILEASSPRFFFSVCVWSDVFRIWH